MLRSTRHLLGLLALVGLATGSALAQDATVTGTVTATDTNEPLIQAAIQIVDGVSRGAVTDVDGVYELTLSPGTYTLRASYTGYEPQTAQVTVTAGQQVSQSFALDPDLAGLEEVVVTGALSSRSRSRSEVAVSRLDAAALTDVQQYGDVNQLLNGKISGVSVQPSSGNVGGGIRFNVRGGGGLNGDGQPLIYVDGIRVDNSQITGFGVGGQGVGALSGLAPDDIATIDVLKGPAAASLYGTDASNGVVLITTKKGTIGGGPNSPLPFSVTYSGTTGLNTQQFEYDEATAGNTADSANDIFQDGGIQQHTLGVSGGSSAVRYFTQFDYRDENGIVFGNFQDRRSVRGNFEAFPLPNLSIGVNSSYTFNTIGSPQNDNNILGYLGNTLLFPVPYQFTDSVAVRNIDTQFRTNQFLGSVEARYTPVDRLQLRAQFGLDASDTRQDQTFPSDFVYSGVTNGERNSFFRENDQISFLFDARYSYQPATGLNATTAIGVQGFDRRLRSLNVGIQNFATSLIPDIGAGADFQAAGEFLNNLRQFGLLAEQSVDYNDTYFLTASLRNDYASTIGLDAPSVFYPGIRGAIRLDQFDFSPELFDVLKLRAAYGESGQLPGSFDGIPLLYAVEVGGDGPGATIQQIGNLNVEPERVREFEAGIDFEFAGRASVEFTYYNQQADESIFGRQLAPSTGLVASSVPFNVGQIGIDGLEFALNATPLVTRDAVVDLGVILSYQTNEVKSVGVDGEGNPLPPLFDGFDVNVLKPGLPRAAFYVQPVNGATFNDAGVYTGVDRGVRTNADGSPVDPNCNVEEDRCYRGNPYPDFNGSFTASINLFQDLTLYALTDFATGLKVFNNTDAFRAQFGNYTQRSELADQLGLTTTTAADGTVNAGDFPDLTPGTQAYIDAANAYARTNGTDDDNFIRDADYLKLREVTVRYNVGRLLSQAPSLSAIQTASLALSARNVFQTSKYDGIDPEVNFNGARSLSRGTDFLTLQNPRQFFLTLTLGI